jgi:hypothetical protein
MSRPQPQQQSFNIFGGPTPVKELTEEEKKKLESQKKQDAMKITAGKNLDQNDIWVKGASIIDLSSLGKKDNTPEYLKSTGPSVYINK